MACTATATPHVIRDITDILRLHDQPCHIGSFDRTNVWYEVRYKDALDMLYSLPGAAGAGAGGALGDLIKFVREQHNKAATNGGADNQNDNPNNATESCDGKKCTNPKATRTTNGNGGPCNGIVYVHKQTDTLDLAQEITKETGIQAIAYHGGMKDVERLEIQRAWMSGEAPIAVATVAFGT